MVFRGDIVVVVINYCFYIFGFLVFNDGKINGNYGFVD